MSNREELPCDRACGRWLGEGDSYEERTVAILDSIGHSEIQRRCVPKLQGRA